MAKFDPIDYASQWHGGQNSWLYAYCSTGKVQHSAHREGILGELRENLTWVQGHLAVHPDDAEYQDAPQKLVQLMEVIETAAIQPMEKLSLNIINGPQAVRVAYLDVVVDNVEGQKRVTIRPEGEDGPCIVIPEHMDPGPTTEGLPVPPLPRWEAALFHGGEGAVVVKSMSDGDVLIDVLGQDRREVASLTTNADEMADLKADQGFRR
jgi:hypothetical protein